jgi:hypothetical protein
MKANRITTISMIIVFLCILLPAVSATTLIGESGTIPSVGITEEFTITADSLPNGISGFEITAFLSDPSKAEITAAITPPWASLSEIGGVQVGGPDQQVTVNADTVDIKVGTFVENSTPISNVTLVTLKIRGDSNGTTGLNISINTIFMANGSPIAASIQNGTINIGSTPQLLTGTLNVTSSPSAADVLLDGVFKGTTPIVIPNVSTGIHTVRVEKTGYSPLENLVEVNTGLTTNVHAVLSEIPPAPVNGTLDVQTTPTGAAVFLDGVSRGITPLAIPDIPAGIHTLRLEKTGYTIWENPVTINAGATTNVTTILTQAPPVNGSINVQSDPLGGNVYLDGVLRGITPVLIPGIAPATHLVRIEKGGFEPWEEVVGVSAGVTTEVNATLIAIPPPPESGSITVQSNPSDANVYLDSVMTGITPVMIPGVTPGSHTVRIEKTGYGPWESTISVSAGATTVVSANLFPITPPPTGSINIQTDPAGANIFLDGVMTDISPALIPGVAPGMHIIRIEKTDFIPWENTISVTAGATTVVSLVLEPESPQPQTGEIDVDSIPRGANAYLDGVFKNITPLSIVGVTPGSHLIKLNKTGYEPWEETIQVVAGETTVVNETLSPIVTPVPTTPAGYGSLYISSSPTRARVLIDNIERGLTDGIIGQIAAGTRQVTVEKAGYHTESFPVTITAEKLVFLDRIILVKETQPTPVPTTTVPTTEPTSLPSTTPTTVPTTMPTIPIPSYSTGSIYVYTLPFGSSVYIDDVYSGMSPKVFKGITPGEHIVRITLPGYQEEIRSVQVQKLKSTLVAVVLVPDLSDFVAVFQ